jgi:hypothetical protein
MSTTKFDNITDLSDYFQGQMIALIEYSTALKNNPIHKMIVWSMFN